MLSFEDVSFAYTENDIPQNDAIRHLSVDLPRGSQIAVVGPNGSGKSTFARLADALELPASGSVTIDGLHPDSMEAVYQIRRRCGMVFQNPDNQIVGTTVEEDVAFGPENLQLPPAEIRSVVDAALKRVGLGELARRSPQTLSGGQKQKLSLAGILAMKPSCIILDEASAMLDPVAARETMAFIRQLCREEGLTLINITHDMEEALEADQILLISAGEKKAFAAPRDVFSDTALLSANELQEPTHLRLFARIRPYLPEALQNPPDLREKPLTESLAADLRALPTSARQAAWESLPEQLRETKEEKEPKKEPLISIQHLFYRYGGAGSEGTEALHDVSLDVYPDEILVLCGHSGSGKSTLITHLNGLFRPQQGSIRVAGLDPGKKEDIPRIREKTGLVFQYPENQLFASTVAEDIAYGPSQLGLSAEECEERVHQAMAEMDLPEELAVHSPFELSGGQMRRVAIAGILAMQPQILVFDEPAAGLDPQTRDELLGQIEALRSQGRAIILVSHNMDDTARLADRLAILAEGRLLAVDTPERLFRQPELLQQAGLIAPAALRLSSALAESAGLPLDAVREKRAGAVLEAFYAALAKRR